MAAVAKALLFSSPFVGAGVGAVAGGGYLISQGLKNSSHETMKDKLGDSLMLASEDSSKWDDRKTSLVASETTSLVEDLKVIKSNSPTGEKVKQWCSTNVKAKFLDEKDTRFLNVKTYCTYKMKDKLTKTVKGQEEDWSTHSNKVKTPAQGTTLSPAMEKIKEALNKTQSPDTDALKNWCKNILESMYENGQDFLDANLYCTKD
ncbi:hypothetical protein HF1_05820 [Mycoplasma haemofelis str. Langford 1]|uniref:Lipoprotein n=1 Tax=Mycoplasma haemofelis (strain Langford 1) TaxID=941640 RepID=E8ZHG9_MYCHL|nr:hypothetical protein [Mycoplasma haemofelis]CBY92590.1 hypothetical protein HF1_05820 [Mycoplasma haemofelis str. Langford 1]